MTYAMRMTWDGGRPWTPRATNPLFWLRQGYGYTTNSGVTAWADFGPRGNTFVDGGATTRATLNATGASNGGPCVTGDGVNDILSNSNVVITQPVIVWLVCKWDTIYASNSTMIDAGTGNKMRLYRSSGTSVVMNAGSDLSSSSITTTAWAIYKLTFNGASSSNVRASASVASGDTGAGGGTGVKLFQFGGGGDFCAGSIADVLCVPATNLSTSTIARIDAYQRRAQNLP